MKYLRYIISLLFPPPQEILELQNLDPEIFISKVSFSIPDDLPTIKSLFPYRDSLVQKALWELKYKGNTKIADIFGSLLYEFILDEISDALLFNNFTKPLLIPLPLSRERRLERGWNQSELLVSSILSHDLHALFDYSFSLLVKTQHTIPQTTLSRKERLLNLKGCFSISNPQNIENRNIILIDDVTTTGSTISEARTTLLQAGARSVIAFTIAH